MRKASLINSGSSGSSNCLALLAHEFFSARVLRAAGLPIEELLALFAAKNLYFGKMTVRTHSSAVSHAVGTLSGL
jgi:hypothetical protein